MAQPKKNVNNPDSLIGKTEPHSVELEQAALGAALIDEDAVMKVAEGLTETDFYLETHRIIFQAICELVARKEPADVITVSNFLGSAGTITSVGGMEYIHSLSEIVPSGAHHEEYIRQLKEKSRLRRVIRTCSDAISAAYQNKDFDQLITETESALYDIRREDSGHDLSHVREMIPDTMDDINDRADPLKRKGIFTRFAGIDALTNGLQPSDLILLAARPSAGKTMFAMNIITNIACLSEKYRNGVSGRFSCAVFSLEMSKVQIVTRMLCSVGRVSMSNVAKGKLTPDEHRALLKAGNILSTSNLYIDDSGAITPTEIFRKCLRLKREKGLDVIVIDYLQLIQGRASDNRVQVVAEITRYLKLAAKELNVPVLLLSQLSRSVEKRDDKTPQLADLRDSGAIEQDADIVMFIHDPNFEKKKRLELPKEELNRRQIVIAKHRNGALGTIDLIMDGEHARFVEVRKTVSRAEALAASDPMAGRAESGFSDYSAIAPDGLPEGFSEAAQSELDRDEAAAAADTAPWEDDEGIVAPPPEEDAGIGEPPPEEDTGIGEPPPGDGDKG